MKKAKILIIDDYKENIEALSALIAADDIEIHSAQNGVDALNILTEHDFCLALLDVQMPEIDGFQLARLIRGVKRYQHLPIIFVTAHQEGSFVLEGYDSGAVDLLFKPLDPRVVRSKVRVFVELKRQKDMLQEQVQELERLRIEADTANLAKSRFLANMSHEIRTPLAAVMGFSELIARGQCTESEREQFVASIKRNGRLLLRLIDDILDLSKIESNHLELEKLDFNLFDLLNDVQSTLSFRAKEKGVTLRFVSPVGLPGHYRSDPIRLKQILLNIIGNAIKFTERGDVDVDVSIEKGSDGSSSTDKLKVIVKDEGVGLTERQMERLFRPFGQADASTARQFGGSGLGLVISKQIAKIMGGDIRLLQSKLGEGSVFEIKIQLERVREQVQAPLMGEVHNESSPRNIEGSLLGKRILAVDDSPENLTLIKMFLKPTGAEVELVTGGQEAISKVKSEVFDLVLMDIQMPGIDGREATRIIRSNGYVKPILALTAHALKSEHVLCRQAGFDDVLVKPINRQLLFDRLFKYLLGKNREFVPATPLSPRI